MATSREFSVSFFGEVTVEDRDALSRRGWDLEEDAFGVAVAAPDGTLSEIRCRHVVRLLATHREQAVRLVVDALGRRPEDVRADPVELSESEAQAGSAHRDAP